LGSECAAGGFVVFVYRYCVCCVWAVWCGFGGVSVQQVALWCLYIGIVCAVCVGQFGVGLGSECVAGGFVVFAYRHCVAVSRGN